MRVTSIFAVLAWAVSDAFCHGGNFATELSRRREFLEERGPSLLQARDLCGRDTADDRGHYERMAQDIRAKRDFTGASPDPTTVIVDQTNVMIRARPLQL